MHLCPYITAAAATVAATVASEADTRAQSPPARAWPSGCDMARHPAPWRRHLCRHATGHSPLGHRLSIVHSHRFHHRHHFQHRRRRCRRRQHHTLLSLSSLSSSAPACIMHHLSCTIFIIATIGTHNNNISIFIIATIGTHNNNISIFIIATIGRRGRRHSCSEGPKDHRHRPQAASQQVRYGLGVGGYGSGFRA